MARAFGIKNQADGVSAQLGGGLAVFGAGDAADFDANGHGEWARQK
jgi:hypothetical protein